MSQKLKIRLDHPVPAAEAGKKLEGVLAKKGDMPQAAVAIRQEAGRDNLFR
ncbi:MAG: hypothetical protein K2Y22_00560 [Candidatus Obscuribacterales bacterium]|nr:hypothetical protein [Candidatus Obscuribacterales bacterium]